jgi:hypothetical protein
MSNLFLKNNSNNTTESSFNLTNILGMNNKSNNIIGGTGNITSSVNLSKINSADINTLLAMLTTEETENNTSTFELENKLQNMLNKNNVDSANLKNILTQNGGNNKREIIPSQTNTINTENTGILENRLVSLLQQNGGNNEISTEVLENKINNIIQNDQTGGAKHLLTFATLGLAGTMLNKNIAQESEYDTTKVLGPITTPNYNSLTQYQVMPSSPTQNINMPSIPTQNINMPSIPTQNINMPSIPTQNINMPSIPTQNPNMSIFQPNKNTSPFDSITSSEMPNNLFTLSETSNNSIFTKPMKPINNTPPTINPFVPLTATTTELSSTSSFMPYNNPSIKNDVRLNQLNQLNQNQLNQNQLNQNQLNQTQYGGNNPGMIVFRELSELVAKTLNIKNGPQAKKIASQLQKDVKAHNEGITHDKLLNAAEKYLTNNIKKYEKLIKT